MSPEELRAAREQWKRMVSGGKSEPNNVEMQEVHPSPVEQKNRSLLQSFRDISRRKLLVWVAAFLGGVATTVGSMYMEDADAASKGTEEKGTPSAVHKETTYVPHLPNPVDATMDATGIVTFRLEVPKGRNAEIDMASIDRFTVEISSGKRSFLRVPAKEIRREGNTVQLKITGKLDLQDGYWVLHYENEKGEKISKQILQTPPTLGSLGLQDTAAWLAVRVGGGQNKTEESPPTRVTLLTPDIVSTSTEQGAQ